MQRNAENRDATHDIPTWRVTALEGLAAAARRENKPEIEAFARRLMVHAKTEEQVSYPAAILVGRYVKQMMAQGS